jgi:hypothetical protein
VTLPRSALPATPSSNAPPAPLTARVLTPALPLPIPPLLPGIPPPAPTFTQQLLLPNGQTATLTTPTPLPPGTTLTLQPQPATPAHPTVVGLTAPRQPAPANTAVPGTPPPNPTVPLPLNQPLTATVEENLTPTTLLLTLTGPAPVANQPLTVTTPIALPLGTTLTFTLTAGGQLTVQSLTPPFAYASHQAISRFSDNWPQLSQTLAQATPAVATQLANRLPQLTGLLPGLANYLDALHHQSPERWLGNDAVTLLRSLGVDFKPDLTQLAALRQPGPDGWQGVLFPYVENSQAKPQQGRFFWRRSQGEQQRAGTNTRFVVEMTLSRLGEVQLDGLLTYPELWLKLRLHPPADTSFAADLQTVVQNILDRFGLSGGLGVESTGTFPLDTRKLIPSPAAPSLAAEF